MQVYGGIVKGYLSLKYGIVNGLVHFYVEGYFSKTQMSLKIQGNNRKILWILPELRLVV